MVDVSRWLDRVASLSPVRRTGDDGRRREQVIAAALVAIEEDGPDVGMASIAERAGVQRPNMYRLFRGKEELDVAVAIVASGDLVGQVRAAFAEPGTPPEIVHRLVDVSVAWAAEHPNLYRFLASRPQTRALHRTRLGRERFLSDLAQQVNAHLAVNAEPPDGAMASLVGLVDAGIIWWLDHADESTEALVDRLSRYVVAILTDVLAQAGVAVDDDQLLAPIEDGEH
ncbi:TetR/AcrR family transcriptional regulator [Nocardioides sp. Kera G14]|uniref:TetR/AcrR family transcriptional regulator n=1 Tax=Nocardioides sp. Kera G14 TaxID=2884264 RepID=UPI001D123A6F|nr:TetR/AcrR family transcriptional regulator [Nocardioides sp. Kera G14]UDY24352.1 TetR/AcrR family transcriptional regulator [Nocardioides sp. Kera G14]